MNGKLLEEILETKSVKILQIVPFKIISLFNLSEGDLNFFFEWCDPELIEGDKRFKEQIKIMWNNVNEILNENGNLDDNDASIINKIRKSIEEKGLDTDFFIVFYSIVRQLDDDVYIDKTVVYKKLDECFNHILKDFKKIKDGKNVY